MIDFFYVSEIIIDFIINSVIKKRKIVVVPMIKNLKNYL
jgi:hypothetical protein